MRLPSLVLFLTVPILNLMGQSSPSEILDAFIEQGMHTWKVPGLSVAIVHKGEVSFIETYGKQCIDNPADVDVHTLGMMGSTTKAITALAVAMLVDEGKVQWQEKVHTILPSFALKDPYITRELTVRDLLCHRTGMGNTDMLWFSGLSAEETLHRMRYADPSYSLRSDYIYQNVMYLAAGKVIEARSGTSWADFIKKRIFDPVGMVETVPYAKLAQESANYLKPHHHVNEQVIEIAHVTAEEIAPAGDVWGSITDMTRWMQFLLDSCRVGDTRLLTADNYSELFRPHTIIPPSKFYGTAELTQPNWTTYGLGWFQQDYRGDAIQYHTGSLPGLVAILGLVPKHDFGVYVFGNLDHAELRHAILWKAIDLFLHEDDSRSWNKEIWDLFELKRGESKARKAKIGAARIANAPPHHSNSQYAGKYQSDLYGTVVISSAMEQLHMQFNSNLEAVLDHWHHNTFRYRWAPYADYGMITFTENALGTVAGFNLFGVHFERRPESKIKN